MRVSGNRRPRGGRSNTGNGRSGSSGGRGNSGNNNRRSNNGNRSYDSNGPDGKIRGSATQVYDKYVSLGRDAQTSGDHVGAENYYQHAEHYYRIMLLNNLVKLDRSSDQDDEGDEDNSVEEEASSDNIDAQPSENTREEKKTAAPKVQKIALAPIIIDLSDPDGSDASEDKPKSDGEDQAAVGQSASTDGDATSEDADDDPDKPKSKRRVSRTRGLRRRTTRKKTSDEENDEPQSA